MYLIFAAVRLTDGRVFQSSYDHKLYAIDARTGTKLWDFAAEQPFGAAVAVAPEGTVFATNHDGKLYALDAASGEKKWDYPLGGRLNRSPRMGPRCCAAPFIAPAFARRTD